MKSDTWVLGLDGGGSKTALAYLSRKGQLSGPFHAPGINPFDRPAWAEGLATLLATHPPPGPLVAATLGLPGYGESPAITQQQAEVCGRLISIPCTLVNDVHAAFLAAFPGGVGALLLSGTGSMAWASDGVRHVRAGGWGDGFGDEGSAFWIGRAALGLAAQALDGRHPDRAFPELLLSEILRGAVHPAALLEWHHTLPHVRSGVAALARTVDRLATDGQPTALGVIEAAAQELARHVHAVRSQLRRPELPWSYAGSVTGSPLLRATLARSLGKPTPPALPPLGGPLYHAAVCAGHDPASALATLTSALSSTATPAELQPAQPPSISAPRAQEPA